jgi:hypothetical protein
MPDFESESMAFSEDEPIDLSANDRLDISYEDDVVSEPQPEPQPVFAAKPIVKVTPQPAPKSQPVPKPEPFPVPPSTGEKEKTEIHKTQDVVIAIPSRNTGDKISEAKGFQRTAADTYDVPVTVQVPVDKDEVTININLRIVIKKS